MPLALCNPKILKSFDVKIPMHVFVISEYFRNFALDFRLPSVAEGALSGQASAFGPWQRTFSERYLLLSNLANS